jgi:hypothetical protein
LVKIKVQKHTEVLTSLAADQESGTGEELSLSFEVRERSLCSGGFVAPEVTDCTDAIDRHADGVGIIWILRLAMHEHVELNVLPTFAPATTDAAERGLVGRFAHDSKAESSGSVGHLLAGRRHIGGIAGGYTLIRNSVGPY